MLTDKSRAAAMFFYKLRRIRKRNHFKNINDACIKLSKDKNIPLHLVKELYGERDFSANNIQNVYKYLDWSINSMLGRSEQEFAPFELSLLSIAKNTISQFEFRVAIRKVYDDCSRAIAKIEKEKK